MQQFEKPTLVRLVLAIGLLALASCGSAPPNPVKAEAVVLAVVSAAADVNPDADGSPKPVVLRVYQLKADASFANADFFALYDQEQETLGADLLAREEFVLAPGDSRKVEFGVQPDARFIGVAAAFRDIRNADWRAITATPKNGFSDLIGKDALQVTAQGTRVTLSVSD